MIKGNGRREDNQIGMLFAAFAMILVGVLCFVYVSYLPPKEKVGSSKPRQNSASPFRWNPDQRDPSSWEDRILRERAIGSQKPPEPEIPEPPKVVAESQVLEEGPEGLVPLPSEKPVPFEIPGILYFDQNGTIPFGLPQKEWNLDLETVRGFRRVGEADLREDGGKLSFHAQNSVFLYPAQDLDQVLFLPEGFVFLPKGNKVPRPVFLTDRQTELKEFLLQSQG